MKKVYTCFTTDVIHEGHLNIIQEAKKYGDVIIGVLSNEAMIKYEQLFWDDIVNENLDKLKLQIHLIENRDIVEIDTVEELNQIEKMQNSAKNV